MRFDCVTGWRGDVASVVAGGAQAGVRSSHKSVIMIYLTGGPPHQDMVDVKPDAPTEIRGEFRPIATNVPGIHISELMPRVAGMMDKFAIIRSLVGAEERHSSFQCVTGRMFRARQSAAIRRRDQRTRLRRAANLWNVDKVASSK